MPIKKILIANRSEIAVRIARSCHLSGLKSVAVYACDDRHCLHVKACDEAIPLKGSGPAAYLDIAGLITAAKGCAADAIHPGYGFLSESAEFAKACKEAGLCFIGPDVGLLEKLGDKASARAEAEQANMPMLQGINRSCSLQEVEAFFERYSDSGVMIKALAGGGGRGIRPVIHKEKLSDAYEACQKEALISFGSGELYVEQLLPSARHIEVQILGDGHKATHLAERECSLQRRNQKIIEIAPSPSLTMAQRERIHAAAVHFAERLKYRGLGTFEFLVDSNNHDSFYFLEVNPRIQVEHTITEQLFDVDLVAIQVALAEGKSLAELGFPLKKPGGHFAIQARVNLETWDEQGNSKATAGQLKHYMPPRGPGIRVDDCAFTGFRYSPAYDPMIAKVIASGPDYPTTLRILGRAIDEFDIQGVDHNLSLLANLCRHPAVIENDVDTRFLEAELESLVAKNNDSRFATNTDEQNAVVEDKQTIEVLEGCELHNASTASVVARLTVSKGDSVQAGQTVAVLEAMKMEFPIKASCAGFVDDIFVSEGDAVSEEQALLTVRKDEQLEQQGSVEEQIDLDAIREDLQEVLERHRKTLDDYRNAAVTKRHAKGMRTARENINDLIDPGSFNEYGAMALAAQRKIKSVEDLIEQSPADGLIGGTASINGEVYSEDQSRCMVLSYDYSVFAGTQGLMNHKKTDRLLGLAKQWQLPVVFFAEGGGGRPSDTDFAGVAGLDCHTFSAMAELSGLVPTVGIVAGRCFAGNVALLGVCDVTIATKNATLGMGGPAMIEGGGLGRYSPEEVGPVDVQGPNGVLDIVVEDEVAAVAAAKQYLSYFQGPQNDWEAHDKRLLRHAIPVNRMQVYDVHQLIEQLADVDSVLELRAEFAKGIVTALVRIEGRPMGLMANNPKYLGGAIDAEGGDKMARFMQLCDAHDLPILSLCDTPGFMVGPESEAQATVRHVSRIFVTASSISVPYLTLVTRKGYGLGAQAMAAGSFHNPMLTAAWPSGEFGAMGIEGAVRLGAAKKLAAIEDENERQLVFQKMVDKIYEHGKALNMASYLEIDAVIDPMESRQWILRALKATPSAPVRKGKKRPCIDTW
ncbi:carboxyl transferase domain-containing protein [Pseudoteredinibacter isoporae]|uniref:Acetyl/propionyl-CoA carboxylase alpha subunit/acetyl-CoA carboxylase carboxyltransferase component n=1 Tax=Pseudoteredinibacter isoporae TaxID=570281 RepID=A0A7X0MXL4_9GAMM|nr:carboxyl transferase domain-containing protein [Pseudoteredinibacter isoporae]MBB6521072.1 acetyl/propionyl-CoA carboxylase alpha subunit/acetyl-CoA carboxylase carboxyltransferase component [Pseudoteredinibacter isoporae]NHO86636.1 ATP-grasp domain-containing protein [Pseudoteredinibacter isoporae]NIB24912.1 ATP-grasp domain-containing protein [Pseudoteredinibacter isoporae]